MNHRQNNTEQKILSDEEIISLYWNREEAAISATDAKYKRYLCTIAYNILNDKSDSEECLNDTYLKTWNSIPPQRPAFISNLFVKNNAKHRTRTNKTIYGFKAHPR